LRLRRLALVGWIGLTVLVWAVLSRTATTWVDAKALVLTSPVLVLLAWGGVAALLGARSDRGGIARAQRDARSSRGATLARVGAALLALALAGGAFASDLAQYHSANLAPTARYEELASVGKRFAGRGPALFTDFDEYSMYALRRLDVGGPDFVYPPHAPGGGLDVAYGRPVQLDRHLPSALAAYPLIVTRRDPSSDQPPAAYGLVWQGAYYEVWARRPRAAPALAHVPAGERKRSLSCARVLRVVRTAQARHAQAIAALAPELVRVRLSHVRRPPGWGRSHGGFTMRRAGTVALRFSVPRAGAWELWLQGQFMPDIHVGVDGRALATVSGQLAGNSLVPDTAAPLRVQLSAGEHRLSIGRAGFSLAPGNGGSAVLAAAFLTPAGAPARVLRTLPAGALQRVLCAQPVDWIELVRR